MVPTKNQEGGYGMRFDRDKLQRAMDEKFYTNIKLAAAAGMSPNTVNRARNGRYVKPSTAERICKALSVKAERVMAKDDKVG